MLRSRFSCEICHLEIASVGCICCRDLLLIGSGCLTQHIKHCKTMHYVISLSLASELISDKANLSKYLLAASPYSSTLRSSNLNTLNSQQVSSRSYLKTSFSSSSAERNIDIDTLSSKVSNIDLNPPSSILYSKHPRDKISSLTKKGSNESSLYNRLQNMQNGFISDLEQSLSIDLSSITTSNLRYLYYTIEQRVFVFDTLCKKVLNMKLPYHKSEISQVSNHRDIISIRTRQRENITLKYNIRTRRYYMLNGCYDTAEWIMHRNNEEYLYMLHNSQFRSYSRRFIRYNFLKNITESLPSFEHINEVHSIAGSGNKIYLFYGNDPRFIEVLNTDTLQFYEIENNLPYHKGYDSKVVCVNNKIYQFNEESITVYDLSFNRIQHIKCSFPYLGELISNFAVLGDQLYIKYYSTSIVVDSLSAERAPSILNQDSASDITSGRYLYRLVEGIAEQIDLKLKSYVACLEPVSEYDIYSVCEYDNDKVIFFLDHRWVICDHILRGGHYITSLNEDIRLHGFDDFWVGIYHMDYTYIFSALGVIRLNMNDETSKITHQDNDFKIRKYPSLVGAGDKIYIIGGGTKSIDRYNIYTDEYSEGILELDYKHAVAKLVDDRIFIISRNTYRIFDQDMNEIERGISNCYDYDVIPASNISLYEGKIYFYNAVSLCIEYFDVKTHKRGAEATRNAIKILHVGLESSSDIDRYSGDMDRSYFNRDEERSEEDSEEGREYGLEEGSEYGSEEGSEDESED